MAGNRGGPTTDQIRPQQPGEEVPLLPGGELLLPVVELLLLLLGEEVPHQPGEEVLLLLEEEVLLQPEEEVLQQTGD